MRDRLKKQRNQTAQKKEIIKEITTFINNLIS